MGYVSTVERRVAFHNCDPIRRTCGAIMAAGTGLPETARRAVRCRDRLVGSRCEGSNRQPYGELRVRRCVGRGSIRSTAKIESGMRARLRTSANFVQPFRIPLLFEVAPSPLRPPFDGSAFIFLQPSLFDPHLVVIYAPALAVPAYFQS